MQILKADHNNLTDNLNLVSPNVLTLDLSHNKFTNVPKDITSTNYKLLQKLLLNGNPMINLNFSEDAKPFEHLQIIDLSNCSISKLDKNLFSK